MATKEEEDRIEFSKISPELVKLQAVYAHSYKSYGTHIDDLQEHLKSYVEERLVFKPD